MLELKTHLRRASLVFAGAASIVLSILGICIFFFSIDLRYSTSKDLWSGLLLCMGPFLSAPNFFILLTSPRWHLRLTWLLACASFLMTWAAVLIYRSDKGFSVDEALSAAVVACQPLVMVTFLVALLVTASHLLKLSSHPGESRKVVLSETS